MAVIKISSIRLYSNASTYITVDNDMVAGLTYKADPFPDGAFKLGVTICQQMVLQINENAFSSYDVNDYKFVRIMYNANSVYATMLIDSVELVDNKYYEFQLTDCMVNLNKSLNDMCDWSAVNDMSVSNIISLICTNLLGYTPSGGSSPFYMWTLMQIDPYGLDMIVTWDMDILARDFISYVAEINGSFARIDQAGMLRFVMIDGMGEWDYIVVNECKDFVLGEEHVIDRVVYEYGTATAKYPDDSSYSGNGDTLYINPNNILITDSGNYTRDGIIQHIYGIVVDYTYWTFKTSRCLYHNDDMRAGVPLEIRDTETDTTYPSILCIDRKYNGGWIGGYELQVETKKQEETQIFNSNERINQINIKVDRELGEIEQQVSSKVGDDEIISKINQSAEQIVISANKIDLTGYTPTNDLLSYIALHADQITLAGSTLIFGDYPNGKYITLDSGTNGVELSGNGDVRMESSNNTNLYLASDEDGAYGKTYQLTTHGTGNYSQVLGDILADDTANTGIYSITSVAGSIPYGSMAYVSHKDNSTDTFTAIAGGDTANPFNYITAYHDYSDSSNDYVKLYTQALFQLNASTRGYFSFGGNIVNGINSKLTVNALTDLELESTSGDILLKTRSADSVISNTQIKTSFNNAVAMGSYQATATTIAGLVDEVRYSSGVMGSVNITTAYTSGNITIGIGWYNFIYSPHRSGGVNGSDSGDNCKYGNLILMSMTTDNGMFKIRIASGAIANVRRLGLLTAGEVSDYVIEQGTDSSWAYRKWASGKIEAWRTATVTASATTQVGSVYRSSGTVALPSSLFNSAPHTIANMDATGTNLFTANAHATSATNIDVRVWRANASTSTYSVDVSLYCWRG